MNGTGTGQLTHEAGYLDDFHGIQDSVQAVANFQHLTKATLADVPKHLKVGCEPRHGDARQLHVANGKNNRQALIQTCRRCGCAVCSVQCAVCSVQCMLEASYRSLSTLINGTNTVLAARGRP